MPFPKFTRTPRTVPLTLELYARLTRSSIPIFNEYSVQREEVLNMLALKTPEIFPLLHSYRLSPSYQASHTIFYNPISLNIIEWMLSLWIRF